MTAGGSRWCPSLGAGKHLDHLHTRSHCCWGLLPQSWVSWGFSTSPLAELQREGSAGTPGLGKPCPGLPGEPELPGQLQLPLLPGIPGARASASGLAGLGASSIPSCTGSSPGATFEVRLPWCTSPAVTQPVALPGMCLVAPSWHPVTAHSSLGFPWHQSRCHPRLHSQKKRGCPRPHPRAVSLSPTRAAQAGAEVENPLGRRNLARNGTAGDVGDTFIIQNYPVLLCKITVCGVSEQGTEGSAGSSITQGSITLITLIRSLPSPRSCC